MSKELLRPLEPAPGWRGGGAGAGGGV